jgi:hypothetical protein
MATIDVDVGTKQAVAFAARMANVTEACRVQEDLDDSAVAARVLGEEIAGIVGDERLSEIAERWSKSPKEVLSAYLNPAEEVAGLRATLADLVVPTH